MALTLEIDGKVRQIAHAGEAVPLVRHMGEEITRGREGFFLSKLKLGWVLGRVRSVLGRQLTMDDFCQMSNLNRRTAYHMMRLADQLADERGGLDLAKYRAACKARRTKPSDKPEELTLRQVELQIGMRPTPDGTCPCCGRMWSGVHHSAHTGAESESVHHSAHTDDGDEGDDGELEMEGPSWVGLADRLRRAADAIDNAGTDMTGDVGGAVLAMERLEAILIDCGAG